MGERRPARTRGRVPFIGLTGGIAAGKSEALAALERLGAATLSSDAVVHELLDTAEIRRLLVDRLGPEVAPGGRVDRSLVAERVFGDESQRRWLEGQLWPRVGERIASWRDELEHAPARPRAAVVEVPLLFESGIEAGFDRTVAVVAEESIRRRRAGERGHSALEGRTSRQLSQKEKAERADFVVTNDGTLEELERSLSEMLATIAG